MLASIVIFCLGAYLLKLISINSEYSDYEKIIEKYEKERERVRVNENKKVEVYERQSDVRSQSEALPLKQVVVSKQSKYGNELSTDALKYNGYIASEADTEALMIFLDKNIGKVVELDLYYPESISLRQYDITGDTPVVRQLNLSSLSKGYEVDNAFSSWGEHHFIHAAGTIQVLNNNLSEYERKNGHLSFWMYKNNHENSMFIINIASINEQILWQTSNDIDEDLREFNARASVNGSEFKLMELFGSFKIEAPVKSSDFHNHVGYPTYPEIWQDEDPDYIHFDPDGEPLDTVVYNLIPQ